MSFHAAVLADSISPEEVRLTTLEATFPRFILAEVNTHRMLSRNSNSSRAIPTEKLIKRVLTDPFVPETFNKRVKGMGVGAALANDDADRAVATWLEASRRACLAAENLMTLDCDKSRANRLLEPFLWHTAILSATEWENFFALRDHEGAQPEFRTLARLMKQAMKESAPRPLGYGQWHLPGLSDEELRLAPLATTYFKRIAAGRLAKWSSYDNKAAEPLPDSYNRAVTLMGNGHFSPMEHIARPFAREEWRCVRQHRSFERLRAKDYNEAPVGLDQMEFSGNFRGWVQMRAEIPNQDNFQKVLDARAAA